MATLSVRRWRDGDSIPLRRLDKVGVTMLGIDPEFALSHAVRLSVAHAVWCEDDRPIAAWGYGAHGVVGTTAYGWLLTSERAAQYPVRFAKESLRAVQHVLSLYLRLEVTCLVDHSVSARWLRWLGFTVVGRTDNLLTLERVR